MIKIYEAVKKLYKRTQIKDQYAPISIMQIIIGPPYVRRDMGDIKHVCHVDISRDYR